MAEPERCDVELLERLMRQPLLVLHDEHRVQPDWREYWLSLAGEVDDTGVHLALMEHAQANPGMPDAYDALVNYVIEECRDSPMLWQARWALALMGWVPAQRDVGSAYAHVAAELRGVVKDVRARSAETLTHRALDQADLRIELAGTLALGWGAVSGGARSQGRPESASLHTHAHDLGQDLLASFWRVPQPPVRKGLPALLSPDESKEELDDVPEHETVPHPTLTVIPALGGDAQKAVGMFVRGVEAQALDYAVAPSHGTIRAHVAELSAAYPHAAAVVDTLLGDLVPDRPIRFRPTLLVGPPGCGKSTFVRGLLDGLLLPYASLDAATTMDQGLVGSPRRWSGAYPSLPVDTVARYRLANPGIVIDELEKAGRSSAGSVTDPLLSLLEPHTARAWRDQCLEVEVDLHAVNWVFTANQVEGIPRPLIDRLRVLRMPPPALEHVPALVSTALNDVLRERGVNSAMEPGLDPLEIAAVTATWGARPTRSLRDLRRIVAAAIDARAAAPKH
ncbi:AAA family ATPase [Aurantimonas sp. Leaf443]|uniref:AAA family ATPase n=1 Tax=Aurantimonas sp. Leaf443 TaxID=1736378 RepID=UPI0006FEAAC2|nr:AAA family ATPase [Aurantimonas sp. Leaf443]KQT86840.1 hypothetical protein ASG48_17540 [Aurantimonas sp. Leaf443]